MLAKKSPMWLKNMMELQKKSLKLKKKKYVIRF